MVAVTRGRQTRRQIYRRARAPFVILSSRQARAAAADFDCRLAVCRRVSWQHNLLQLMFAALKDAGSEPRCRFEMSLSRARRVSADAAAA